MSIGWDFYTQRGQSGARLADFQNNPLAKARMRGRGYLGINQVAGKMRRAGPELKMPKSKLKGGRTDCFP